MSKGVFRSDNMKCTKDGNIRSAKYYSADTTQAAIENGMLVDVSTLLEPTVNREIFKAIKPTTASINLGVVGTPELIYDEQLTSTGALDKFENKAGQPITVLMLAPGDILSVSDECIDHTGTPDVADVLTNVANSTKWTYVDGTTVSTANTLNAVIIARELYSYQNGGKYLNVIQIVSIG